MLKVLFEGNFLFKQTIADRLYCSSTVLFVLWHQNEDTHSFCDPPGPYASYTTATTHALHHSLKARLKSKLALNPIVHSLFKKHTKKKKKTTNEKAVFV